MQQPVSLRRIGELCQLSSHTVWKWVRRRGLQSCIMPDGRMGIWPEDFDAFLATCARDFRRAPTLKDLTTGRLKLVSAAQANERYHIHEKLLWERASHGRLPHVKFPGNRGAVRFSETAVVATLTYEIYIPVAMVQHFIGAAHDVVDVLAAQGKLVVLRLAFDRKNRYITRQSLMGLIKVLLPEWVGAERWFKLRLESTEPLLTATVVKQLIGRYELKRQVGRHLLPYIGTIGGRNRWFEPATVQQHMERMGRQ